MISASRYPEHILDIDIDISRQYGMIYRELFDTIPNTKGMVIPSLRQVGSKLNNNPYPPEGEATQAEQKTNKKNEQPNWNSNHQTPSRYPRQTRTRKTLPWYILRKTENTHGQCPNAISLNIDRADTYAPTSPPLLCKVYCCTYTVGPGVGWTSRIVTAWHAKHVHCDVLSLLPPGPDASTAGSYWLWTSAIPLTVFIHGQSLSRLFDDSVLDHDFVSVVGSHTIQPSS